MEEAERLDRLVTNLLELAKFEGGTPEIRKRLEPLDEIVEASLARLHGRLGNRPVNAHVPQEVPMVPMEPVLIQQVLTNLLENALRYTPESSPIEVEATSDGERARVEVRDHGPGIVEAEAPRLFERFYRGRAGGTRDGGVGLGLTICRAIVEAHGGSISISNHADGGAVAGFSLPLASTKEGLVVNAALRVLVIEDEAHMRRFLRTTLAHNGYDVVDVATGRPSPGTRVLRGSQRRSCSISDSPT